MSILTLYTGDAMKNDSTARLYDVAWTPLKMASAPSYVETTDANNRVNGIQVLDPYWIPLQISVTAAGNTQRVNLNFQDGTYPGTFNAVGGGSLAGQLKDLRIRWDYSTGTYKIQGTATGNSAGATLKACRWIEVAPPAYKAQPVAVITNNNQIIKPSNTSAIMTLFDGIDQSDQYQLQGSTDIALAVAGTSTVKFGTNLYMGEYTGSYASDGSCRLYKLGAHPWSVPETFIAPYTLFWGDEPRAILSTPTYVLTNNSNILTTDDLNGYLTKNTWQIPAPTLKYEAYPIPLHVYTSVGPRASYNTDGTYTYNSAYLTWNDTTLTALNSGKIARAFIAYVYDDYNFIASPVSVSCKWVRVVTTTKYYGTAVIHNNTHHTLTIVSGQVDDKSASDVMPLPIPPGGSTSLSGNQHTGSIEPIDPPAVQFNYQFSDDPYARTWSN